MPVGDADIELDGERLRALVIEVAPKDKAVAAALEAGDRGGMRKLAEDGAVARARPLF